MTTLMLLLTITITITISGLSALLTVKAVAQDHRRHSRPHLMFALVSALLVPGLLGVLFVRGKMTAALHGDFKVELSPIELLIGSPTNPCAAPPRATRR